MFPKLYMSRTELVNMGLSRDMLIKLAHSKNQSVAFRDKPRGKFLYNTKKLEKYLDMLTR